MHARLGALISVVALTFVALWVSNQEAPRLPSSAGGYGLLAGSVVLYGAIMAARGWRWDEMLRHAGMQHRRADAYALTTVGYMGNVVLPARGGDVLRMLLLSARSDALRRQGLGSLVTERVMDGLALIALLAVVTAAGVGASALGTAPAIAGIVLVAAAALALWGYLRLRRAGRFETFARRVRPIARMGRVILTPWGIVLCTATLGVWLAESGVLWLVSASLDLGLAPLDAVFLVVLVSLSALIPAGPGYVGTFDAAFIFGIEALGVTGGAAVACLLLYRFVIFVPVTVVGLALLLLRYGGLRSLRRASAAPDDEELLAEQAPGGRRVEVPARQLP